jgi:lipooligosaccharide transport system permease protein
MDAPSYRTEAERQTADSLRTGRLRFALPANATNWLAVWRRNYLVWRKLALASMFGNLADPMI